MKAGRLEERLAGLTGMSTAELRQEWERVHRAPAPVNFVADLLARGIAYKLQERAYGGLTADTRRVLSTKANNAAAAAPRMPTGSRLVREWGGRTHHILVNKSGFSYQDRDYRSLSQIAQIITGAKWSGPRFFGLNNPTSNIGTRHVAA